MRSGSTLAMRVNGEIEVMQDLPITHETLDGLFREELSAEDYDKFCQTRDIDFAMTVSGQRFRASGYHTMRG
jgi:twitching motility protein PilT